MEKMNIYQKMSNITSELSVVAKNLEVGVGKSKYKAVGEADVLNAIKPLEAKYGVYSFPCGRKVIDSAFIENESIDYDTKQKIIKRSIFERIETIYRFVNIDEPSEYIDITTYGDGIDTGDKSVGKAMTYADKYALMKAYKVITGDDPDQEESHEVKKVVKTAPEPKITENQKLEFARLQVNIANTIKHFGVASENDLTEAQAQFVIETKKKALEKENGNLS